MRRAFGSSSARTTASSARAPASRAGRLGASRRVWSFSIAICGVETGLLMEEGEPAGGRWNFDAENRKRLPPCIKSPRADRILARRDHPRGSRARGASGFPKISAISSRFGWAVTRADALAALEDFIARPSAAFRRLSGRHAAGRALPAIIASISPYLNIGLLTPREVCAAAEQAFREGQRAAQRRRGVHPPDPRLARIRARHLLAPACRLTPRPTRSARTRPLPELLLDRARHDDELRRAGRCGDDACATPMRHHIQRLMVTGNFALLAGLAPAEVEAWYLARLRRRLTNGWNCRTRHGMALFADGGVLASKPYAASGAYIDRMSDYCAVAPMIPRRRRARRPARSISCIGISSSGTLAD